MTGVGFLWSVQETIPKHLGESTDHVVGDRRVEAG
jgi:hypothetical protein